MNSQTLVSPRFNFRTSARAHFSPLVRHVAKTSAARAAARAFAPLADGNPPTFSALGTSPAQPFGHVWNLRFLDRLQPALTRYHE